LNSLSRLHAVLHYDTLSWLRLSTLDWDVAFVYSVSLIEHLSLSFLDWVCLCESLISDSDQIRSKEIINVYVHLYKVFSLSHEACKDYLEFYLPFFQCDVCLVSGKVTCKSRIFLSQSLTMSESSQLHNVVYTEILKELQLSTSQESIDFKSSNVLYAENAYKLRVDENSDKTVEMRANFLSVTMTHVLIIFSEDHTAFFFI